MDAFYTYLIHAQLKDNIQDVFLGPASSSFFFLSDNLKRKATFLFCKSKNPQCILLQETHSQDSDVKFWSTQWGDKIIFSHGTSRSAGVAILFNNCPGMVTTTKSSNDGHWIICVLQLDDSSLTLANIYGYNNTTQNKNLLSDIREAILELKERYHTENVIIGGDWNMVLDEWIDRSPSKFTGSHPNPLLTDFCRALCLHDPWREKNPNLRQFSWFKPDATVKSRLDYWLVSDIILNQISNCEVSPAPLTDHCCVDLTVTPVKQSTRTKGYWKFNASLLKYDEYNTGIKNLFQEISQDDPISSYTQKWEFLKYKICQYTISFSKQIKKINGLEVNKIIKEIHLVNTKPRLTENDKNNLSSLQSKLDKIYERKARGAFIRSRSKWIEEGEKNSAYFCRLEKRRQSRNSIKILTINDADCSDPKLIAKEVSAFYQNLYSSSFSVVDSDSFLNGIKDFIPRIDSDFKEECEKLFTMEELDKAVMCLKLDKSPGPDGLTANFYRHFWGLLRNFLFQVFREAIITSSLPVSMKQGIITLIPKPGKDSKLLDNYRPISLLNYDYKLLTYIYTNRLKGGLDKIISETQTGFVRDRSIHNNIRLVQDLLDYSHLIEDKGFILFLDFYKAFDMLEHQFLFKVLHMYGFGPNFCRTIESFYKDTTSTVALPQGTSPRFTINRGVKQGCNISPFLFILAAEMLAIHIKNSDVAKLNVFDQQIVISQLADDTTIFVKNLEEIPKVFELINMFSKASGLTLNHKKCELMAIHDCNLTEAQNIPIKSSVKYLGIHITKDARISETLNLQDKIPECKSKLDMWLQRDLTVFGRTYLTKMESLARCIYPAYSMAIPDKFIKAVNQLNFNFIWKNRVHYFKKSEIVKDYEDGGLKAIDFECLNAVLKLKWLKSFLLSKNCIWYCLPRGLFKKLGGIEFVLKCDFQVEKLPTKLSTFHKQVLLCWKLMYTHNFTPHQTPIWNNRYVVCNGRSLYLQHWMDKNIRSVTHLMDDQGHWLSYDDFRWKYNITCTYAQFRKVIRTIPESVRGLVQNMETRPGVINLPPLHLDGFDFLVEKKNLNNVIRSHLNKQTTYYSQHDQTETPLLSSLLKQTSKN